MKIEVLKRLTEQNDAQADEIRKLLSAHQTALINIMGSPGCGKTTLLESSLRLLCPATKCAVLEGDLATTQDAQRIADLEVPVAQLLTEGGCHLKANLVHSALTRIGVEGVDCVFVENVGNLVCPAGFDLGEHARAVVLSVAEGHDKVTKYPNMFQKADLIVITKLDLLSACAFDMERVRVDIKAVNPQAQVLEVSSISGDGIPAWNDWVQGVIAKAKNR